MTPRPSFALGSAFFALLSTSLALAGDASPLDTASGRVSEALTALKDVKLGSKQGDDHLERARAYLARARVELLKARGQDRPE